MNGPQSYGHFSLPEGSLSTSDFISKHTDKILTNRAKLLEILIASSWPDLPDFVLCEQMDSSGTTKWWFERKDDLK
jgi:hypothetical protein